MALKTYRVDAKLRFPSWNHTGYWLEIHARTKREAIRRMRQLVWSLGHTRAEDGLDYTAAELED